jgi:hypothetical protein
MITASTDTNIRPSIGATQVDAAIAFTSVAVDHARKLATVLTAFEMSGPATSAYYHQSCIPATAFELRQRCFSRPYPACRSSPVPARL